jgi:hypothetical protein
MVSSLPAPKRRGRRTTLEANLASIWANVEVRLESAGGVEGACKELADVIRTWSADYHLSASRLKGLYHKAISEFETNRALRELAEKKLVVAREAAARGASVRPFMWKRKGDRLVSTIDLYGKGGRG